MYKDIKIKTFSFENLVGRDLRIRMFDGAEGVGLIVAIDLKSGESFVLKENKYDLEAPGDIGRGIGENHGQ